jgi:mycofactocin precursor
MCPGSHDERNPDGQEPELTTDSALVEESLVEEVSIDGMCRVY